MANLHPVKLATSLLALGAAALFAMACLGGEKESAISDPAVSVPPGLSVTLYASPT